MMVTDLKLCFIALEFTTDYLKVTCKEERDRLKETRREKLWQINWPTNDRQTDRQTDRRSYPHSLLESVLLRPWVSIHQPFCRTFFVFQIFLYFEAFECNTTSDWLKSIL